ncbi:MAG: 16S rRNA (cytidine(1402)-2'-O)-methyltransferase [Chloroflexota bacterium]
MTALYIVATPIGNLEDISLRALRTLREVNLIAAEDTRKTKRLLNAYGIKTRTTSFHEHNRQEKMSYLIDFLGSGSVALVSEAGMPGISDPGYELIVAASRQGITVIPIPGPSAVVTALAVSGLPTDRFLYLGFLPNRSAQRRRYLESAANEPGTLVVFEAPHRLKAALNDILRILGDRRIVLCREMTKMFEEVFRGTVKEAIEHFPEPRGEFTLVIDGQKEKPEPEMTEDVLQSMDTMRLSGVRAKEAISRVTSDTGLSRREVYQAWLRQKNARENGE